MNVDSAFHNHGAKVLVAWEHNEVIGGPQLVEECALQVGEVGFNSAGFVSMAELLKEFRQMGKELNGCGIIGGHPVRADEELLGVPVIVFTSKEKMGVDVFLEALNGFNLEAIRVRVSGALEGAGKAQSKSK